MVKFIIDNQLYIIFIVLFILYCRYLVEQNGLGMGWHIALAFIIYSVCNSEAIGLKVGISAFLLIEILYFIWLSTKNYKIKSCIEYHVKEHISTLAVKFRQCRNKDAYGQERISNRWYEEKTYFLRNVCGCAKITPLEYGFFDGCFNVELCKFEKKHRKNALYNSEKSIRNGVDYENFVARVLLKNHPNIKIDKTPATGDQGADLLLTFPDGKRTAVQCKWYSSSVGNFSVQEVVAALRYYYADGGMVVTNSTFTKKARQLAEANNIQLYENVSPKNLDTLKLMATEHGTP